MARRGASGLAGILPVDKPTGMTSHDVVARIRRVSGEGRVGHAGTLDPSATGLLVILIGPATRLTPYLTAAEKTYDARVVFGSETDTDDSDGQVTRTEIVPASLGSESGAIAHVASLVGTSEQMPPAYSAIKRGGVTSYSAARKGESIDLEPRTIHVTDATLLGVEPGPPIAWNVSLRVSKGTYIRAIARDLGRELGTAAHLGGLRRTSSGELDIASALTLDEIEELGDKLPGSFTDPAKAIGLPALEIDDETAAYVIDGRPIELDATAASVLPDGPISLTRCGTLEAIYQKDGSSARAALVLPGGVRGSAV